MVNGNASLKIFRTQGPGGAGVRFLQPQALGTAAPSNAKNREIDRPGVRRPLRKIEKYIESRKPAGFPQNSNPERSSDGVISTTAFFVEFRVSNLRATKVSCQEERDGRAGS